MNMPSHDIFHKPGDESKMAPPKEDVNVEDRDCNIPTPSHDVVNKPGDEASPGPLSQNDPSYVQGYLDPEVGVPTPGYVGPGGPDVRRTYVPPASGADPTPEMPGAK